MRQSKRLYTTFVVAAALGLLAGGCGGGGGVRYSKPAFVACLHQNAVPTQDINHPVTASDKAVAEVLKPISPNFIVAKFADGEFVGFAFGSDVAGASRILDALKKLAQSPGATPGKLTQTGNLVLLTNPHITAGVDKIISTCETDAVVK